MDVLFLTALVSEFAEVSRALGKGWPRAEFLRIKYGKLGRKSAAVVQLGIGRQRARKGTLRAIDELRPARIVVVGVAGGLQADLEVGQVVVPAEVALAGGEHLPIDPPPPHWPPAVSIPRLLTVEEVAKSAELKRRLAETHRASAVDMETFDIVRVSRDRGLPVHVVRIVSDGHEDELPPEIDQLIDEDGNPRLFRAFKAFLRRPRILKDVLRLEANNKIAFQAAQDWLSALAKEEEKQAVSAED